MYGFLKSMCVVFVIPVCMYVFPPDVRFVCLYVGSAFDSVYVCWWLNVR